MSQNLIKKLISNSKNEDGRKENLNILNGYITNSILIHDYLNVCYKGEHTADAEWLIKHKIDITKVCVETIDKKDVKKIVTPLERSCERQYVETINPLITNLEKQTLEDRNKILCSSLSITIKRLGDDEATYKKSNEEPDEKFDEESNEYIECYKLVLQAVKRMKDLDTEQYEDIFQQTPLFYANYYNHPKIAVEILETVCLINDRSGVSPIYQIDTKTLEEHLDRCITTEKGPSDNPGTHIKFNFETLLCRERHKHETAKLTMKQKFCSKFVIQTNLIISFCILLS
ncbi:hypothetical protein Zmor_000400 [Zophobas morio]|uniref:Uncharacterized protein n=1 Tax=Zophobas morio TaxID=2755281 RepID=A0AA38IXF7_9CUCU|nr:hypothetical protein Zmor_000400 [Zophobas morio]